MTLTLIAALDSNEAIGRNDGGLAWHLPDESAHFRAACAGKSLLVGRRTFEEMDGWFQPDHRVIVLTRRPLPRSTHTHPQTALVTAATVPEAMALARQAPVDDLLVIGGARTYAEALPCADHMVLSRIDLHSGASIHFPPVNWAEWSLVHTQPARPDTATGITFAIEYWERRRGEPSSLKQADLPRGHHETN